MMRKCLFGAIVLVVVFTLIGCGGGGKYSDALEINTKFADAMEDYIGELESADDAGAIAKAVNSFAAKVEKIAPRMKKLIEKYPELKNKDNYPKELKESQKRATELGQRMVGAMMKTMQHMRDKNVKAAHERLQKAMAMMSS